MCPLYFGTEPFIKIIFKFSATATKPFDIWMMDGDHCTLSSLLIDCVFE